MGVVPHQDSPAPRWENPDAAFVPPDLGPVLHDPSCITTQAERGLIVQGTLPHTLGNKSPSDTIKIHGNPWQAWRQDGPYAEPSYADVPVRLGRFERRALIGEGGMATIFLAKLAGPIGFERPVALKVLQRHLRGDALQQQRFVEEALLTARMQHPNIVQVYELGVEEGISYVSMELLMGEQLDTLADRLRRWHASKAHSLDARLACHIIAQAGEGLHYAHEFSDLEGRPLHLVHRDISPQNLFVTYSGTVKVLDFGLVKALRSAHTTQPGVIKGKVTYMAPEQIACRPLDRRTDLYALAINLWELLVGRSLFDANTRIANLKHIPKTSIPPISQIRDDVPEELDTVLERALSMEPYERHPDVLAFLGDLREIANQLGGPMSTSELSAVMQDAFPIEIHRKTMFVANAMRDDASAGDGIDDPVHDAPPSDDTFDAAPRNTDLTVELVEKSHRPKAESRERERVGRPRFGEWIGLGLQLLIVVLLAAVAAFGAATLINTN